MVSPLFLHEQYVMNHYVQIYFVYCVMSHHEQLNYLNVLVLWNGMKPYVFRHYVMQTYLVYHHFLSQLYHVMQPPYAIQFDWTYVTLNVSLVLASESVRAALPVVSASGFSPSKVQCATGAGRDAVTTTFDGAAVPLYSAATSSAVQA